MAAPDVAPADLEEQMSQGIVQALQAPTWDAALAMVQGVPGLQLAEEQEVFFCELYDLIRMRGTLAQDVSTTCLENTLDDMREFLPANVVTALHAHMANAGSGAVQ